MNEFVEFIKVLCSIGIAIVAFMLFTTSGSKGSKNSDSWKADDLYDDTNTSSFSSRLLYASVATIAIVMIFCALFASAINTAGFPFDCLSQYKSIKDMWASNRVMFVRETAKLISLVVVATTLSYIIPKSLFGGRFIPKIIRFLIIVVATIVLNRIVYDRLSGNQLVQSLLDHLSSFLAGASTVTWTTCIFSTLVGNLELGEKIAGGAIGAFILKKFPETFPAKVLSKSFSIAITILVYLFVLDYMFGGIGNLIDQILGAVGRLLATVLSLAIMLFVGSAVWKAFTTR